MPIPGYFVGFRDWMLLPVCERAVQKMVGLELIGVVGSSLSAWYPQKALKTVSARNLENILTPFPFSREAHRFLQDRSFSVFPFPVERILGYLTRSSSVNPQGEGYVTPARRLKKKRNVIQGKIIFESFRERD